MADVNLDDELEKFKNASSLYRHIIEDNMKKVQAGSKTLDEAKKASSDQIKQIESYTKSQKKSSEDISNSMKKLKENFNAGALTASDLEEKLATLRAEVKNTSDQAKRSALIAEKAGLEEASARNKAGEIFKSSMGELGGKVMAGFANSITKTAASALAGGDALTVATTFMSSNIDTANAASQAGSNALSSFGAATAGAGGKVGRMGRAASVAGAGLGFLSNSVSELAKAGIGFMLAETRKLITGFQSMSASGAMYAGGMKEMVITANSAGMTLESFSKVVGDNKDALSSLGMGVGEGSKKLASVMAGPAIDSVRKGMFALGMGMEEQASAYAQVMAQMAGPTGKLNASNAEIVARTENYAKNLKLLSDLTGEDMKAKQEKIRQENDTLAFQQQLDGKTVEERADIVESMKAMSDDQRKALRERMIYGTLISKDLAITEATNSGIAKANQQSYAAALDGSLSASKQTAIMKDNAKEAYEAGMSNKALAMSTSADAQASSASQNKTLQYMQKFAKTDEERAKIAEQIAAGKEGGRPEVAIQELQNAFAVAMEKIANENLPQFTKAIETTIKDIEGSVKELAKLGITGGSTPAWITALVGIGSAVLQILPLMTKGGMLGGVGAVAAKGAGIMGSAGKSVLGSGGRLAGGVLGSVVTAGLAANDYMDISAQEKAGTITKEDAKKAKSGVVGEAGGGLAGGLAGAAAGAALGSVVPVIGTIIGGLLGGALGAWGGGAAGKAGGEAVSGHFANGGIASGPSTGYTSMLHGKELVLPMKEDGSLKENSTGMNELMKMLAPTGGNSSGNDEMAQLVKEQNSKLDDLIRIMGDNRDYTERLMHNMS